VNADENNSPENVPSPEQKAPSWCGWFDFFRWPNGTTAWAIILTLIAIAEQTGQTRKAADAAFLNAQYVANAERALLLFTVEKKHIQGSPGAAIFRIKVVNYGKVPARRLEISQPLHATMTLKDFVSLSTPRLRG
jgi:hypothetical protein